MKETELRGQDKTEVTVIMPVKKELKFMGSFRPKPGHKCFQLNLRTGEVTDAEFESTEVDFRTNKVRKKLISKENCIYVTALNMKNAIRHFKKMVAAGQK